MTTLREYRRGDRKTLIEGVSPTMRALVLGHEMVTEAMERRPEEKTPSLAEVEAEQEKQAVPQHVDPEKTVELRPRAEGVAR